MGLTYPNSWHIVVCRDSTVPFLRNVSSMNFYWRNMKKASWPWQGSLVNSIRSRRRSAHSSLSVRSPEFSRIFSMMHVKVSIKTSDMEARRNLWVTAFHHSPAPLQFRIWKILTTSGLWGWGKEGKGIWEKRLLQLLIPFFSSLLLQLKWFGLFNFKIKKEKKGVSRVGCDSSFSPFACGILCKVLLYLELVPRYGLCFMICRGPCISRLSSTTPTDHSSF